jgi:hypothetical protein
MFIRQTAIAVIEAHNVETLLDKQMQEVFWPSSHLSTKAHDPQQGGVLWITQSVVLDIDSVWQDGLRHLSILTGRHAREKSGEIS